MPVDLTLISFQRGLSIPLSRQLYVQLHHQIMQGSVIFKEKLPPTRELAKSLKLSRGVITECYEMLRMEGLIAGFGKGGTRVQYQPKQTSAHDFRTNKKQGLSARAGFTTGNRSFTREPHLPLPLTPGVPDLSLFPIRTWHSFNKTAFQEAPAWYIRNGGTLSLKRALANYLAQYRGINVTDPDCLIMTTGSQATLSLLARLLADPGDTALLEQPCWSGAEAALAQAELQTEHVEIPLEGTTSNNWIKAFKAHSPRFVVTTPAVQFPTGKNMSLDDREILLQLSADNNCWVIEDDYAAEYSFAQHPSSSIMAQASTSHVIHMGTMSKLLFPGLRLGWVIVPRHIAESINNAINTCGLIPSYVQQQQLALFIQFGHLSSHLANTRAVYNERRVWSADHIARYGNHVLTPTGGISGMNQYFELKGNTATKETLRTRLRKNDLGCDIYTPHRHSNKNLCLLLGHANLGEDELPIQLEKLYKVLESCLAG